LRRLGRSGISVMFMTFIAVCILTTIFLTYYLHLTRLHADASEAERMYAEASQERVEAYYDPVKQVVSATNRGGMGVEILYIVEVDREAGVTTLTMAITARLIT